MDAQEARIYVAVIITGLVLGIIIIYFTLSVIRQQRRNLELQKANALAEISAMEKERARIAADLHDDLGPVLSVVKFQIDHVEQLQADEKLELVKASKQLDELITRMREVANDLMPSALHRKGLVSAVSEFVRTASAAHDIPIDFLAVEGLVISEEKSINIYRVMQEVIHNSIKHAKAGRIEVVFTLQTNFLKITCRDNGLGFDHAIALKSGDGIGLRSIRNRTEIMGGHMEVASKAGKGTVYIFEIPIK